MESRGLTEEELVQRIAEQKKKKEERLRKGPRFPCLRLDLLPPSHLPQSSLCCYFFVVFTVFSFATLRMRELGRDLYQVPARWPRDNEEFRLSLAINSV